MRNSRKNILGFDFLVLIPATGYAIIGGPKYSIPKFPNLFLVFSGRIYRKGGRKRGVSQKIFRRKKSKTPKYSHEKCRDAIIYFLGAWFGEVWGVAWKQFEASKKSGNYRVTIFPPLRQNIGKPISETRISSQHRFPHFSNGDFLRSLR